MMICGGGTKIIVLVDELADLIYWDRQKNMEVLMGYESEGEVRESLEETERVVGNRGLEGEGTGRETEGLEAQCASPIGEGEVRGEGVGEDARSADSTTPIGDVSTTQVGEGDVSTTQVGEGDVSTTQVGEGDVSTTPIWRRLESDEWKMLRGSVEGSLIKLSILGRAAGIHLVLGTQRPDASILSGQLRANIVTRICLRVSNDMERRIILGCGVKGLSGERFMMYNGELGTLKRELK